MSKFLTHLEVILMDDRAFNGRGSWVVDHPLVYLSSQFGLITVPQGFETDFASVPRLPLAFALLGDIGHPAGVVHDWLYTSCELTRADADECLREAMVECGVPRWKARAMWLAVRLFGGKHYQRK